MLPAIDSETTVLFPQSESTPTFSKTTLSILQEQNFTPPASITALKSKIKKLETLQANLLRAQNHPVRDKIVSLLAMAFAIGILASGIIGTYYCLKIGGALSALVALKTFLVTLALAYCVTLFYNSYWSDDDQSAVIDIDDALISFLVLPFIGPFIPVWQTFGNKERYRKLNDEKKPAIEHDIGEIKQFFIDKGNDYKNILEQLDKAKAETQTNLINLQQQTVRTKEAEDMLTLQLQNIEQAHKDLTDAQVFFSQI